jgi:hypothetical protein
VKQRKVNITPTWNNSAVPDGKTIHVPHVATTVIVWVKISVDVVDEVKRTDIDYDRAKDY